MKKIIYEIFTNRLGNILAISNLALIAVTASGIALKLGLFTWMFLSFLLNLPAQFTAAILLSNSPVSYYQMLSGTPHYAASTLVFVYLQWVGIGWFARKISESIQPHLSKLL
jgi:hypothetical protein